MTPTRARGPALTVAALVCGLAGCVEPAAPAPPEPSIFDDPPASWPPPDEADAVFDPSAIADIQLVMDPADWADIRDDPKAFRWHEATFFWRGERVPRVGVRAFGKGSLAPGKPSLKLSFDHFVDGQRWRGLEALKLDNSRQDPTYLGERLCTDVLRALGLPAARTGWADVAVNGEHVGFFVALEPIDDPFLRRWFGGDDGALYGTVQGAWGQGLMPLDDPLAYYDPQDGDAGDGSDLVALTEVVARGSDAELAAAIDLPGAFRTSVTRSVLGAQDAFSADGNNFYLYDDRGTWRIVPWDFDYELATDGVAVALAVDPWAPWTTSRWAHDSLRGEPYVDPVLLRSLDMGADVDAVIDDLLAGPLRWSRVDATITASADRIRAAVAADVLPDRGPAFARHVADLRLFLHARLSALAGGEVADCPAPPAGTLRAAELAPTGAVGWGELSIDRTAWGPGLMVAGQHFCGGLFAHAPSAVTLQVPAAGALRGAVGLHDWDDPCGEGARFLVSQGGVVLWQSDVLRRYDPAVAFGPLPVAAGPVVLTTDDLGDRRCDTTSWLDLTFTPA